MFGDTPMRQGLETILNRFEREEAAERFGARVLFMPSDGAPTDSDNSDLPIIENVEKLKQKGIVIISCYLTDHDVNSPRTLYGQVPQTWPEGAKLMFNCASEIPIASAFDTYLNEIGWKGRNRESSSLKLINPQSYGSL
jgi:hypothetical protein